ncbi:MAG: sugar ABC transporter substrate-binding protein, partial [Reinekea sp.]|nr:sugar ABC transporter substrate-binding protein [Reinekea sp.]
MKTQLKAGVAALSLLAAATFAADIRIDGFPDYDTQINAIKDGLPQHNIEMLKNNHGDHHNKLKTNLATGSGAGDVVLIDVGFIGSFVNAGGFVDLTDFYKGMAGDYASYAVEAGKGNDGKQY